jgi:hypothetical protein
MDEIMIQERFKELLSLCSEQGKKGSVKITLLEKTAVFFELLKQELLERRLEASKVYEMLAVLNASLPLSAAKPSKDLPKLSTQQKSHQERVLERLRELSHDIAELLEPQPVSRIPRTTKHKLRARHKASQRRWVQS